MGCTCAIDMGEGDFSEILFEKIVKARKEHRCHECYITIKPGEEYYKEKSVYDCILSTHKTCLDCKSIRDNMLCAFSWGEIIEDVRGYIRGGFLKVTEDCLSQLTPKARERICDIIESTWNDDEEYS